MHDFSEELTELRNTAAENAQAVRRAESLIVRLKREISKADSTVGSVLPNVASDSATSTAVESRELQLYRQQEEDDQKKDFFALVAHSPERYEEVRYSMSETNFLEENLQSKKKTKRNCTEFFKYYF